MPIVDIIKKAWNGGLSRGASEERDIDYEDNEILFCKNNICVHPPTIARQESDIVHFPGYITLTTKTFIDQYNNAKRHTLLLTWIPNSTLYKCHSVDGKNRNGEVDLNITSNPIQSNVVVANDKYVT